MMRPTLRGTVFLVALTSLLWSIDALATPFYGVESAGRCDSCHVEPLGWLNPDMADRRCTLDCSGCHISPTGGGMRTPLGRYYGENELAMFGRRPSEMSNPERFLPEGWPSEGRHRIFRGWNDGWWPGEVSHRDIPDRYGDINPAPIWQMGGDYRGMAVFPTDQQERDIVAFPMEAQLYAAVHPLSNLTAYLDLGYQGSVQATPGGQADNRAFNDVFWIREMFVMVHDLPWGAYVRAGRFALPYGWRVPDHTAYIRSGFFDQYRQGYGVELGLAANEGWGNLAIYRQGIDSWPGDNVAPGFGVSGTGGVRFLGYQMGVSAHFMSGIDGTDDEFALGPMWAINAEPFTYLGEFDWRRFAGADEPIDTFTQYHEVRWSLTRGFSPKVRWEFIDRNVLYVDDHANRVLVGFEFNPVRYLQFDIAYRRAWIPQQLDPSEVLVQLHVWAL